MLKTCVQCEGFLPLRVVKLPSLDRVVSSVLARAREVDRAVSCSLLCMCVRVFFFLAFFLVCLHFYVLPFHDLLFIFFETFFTFFYFLKTFFVFIYFFPLALCCFSRAHFVLLMMH